MSTTWSARRKVRHQLEFGSVWEDRDSIENHDGLVRAIRVSTADRGELVEGVTRCLTDENLLVRSGAVATLLEVAEDLGATRIYQILQSRRELFQDVQPAFSCGFAVLEEGVAQAIGKAVKPADTEAILYLREAVREPWGHGLVFRLAAVDGDWVVEHAAEVVPRTYIGILIWLTPERRRKIIAAIGPFTTTPTEYFWNHFSAEEAAELKLLLSESKL